MNGERFWSMIHEVWQGVEDSAARRMQLAEGGFDEDGAQELAHES
jgi:hypothetical protein